jgi:AcrR family transcriptional regulator
MKRRQGSKANRSALSLEQAVVGFAREFPQLGQAKAADELRKQGHAVSASGVRYIWKKHKLETAYKRLKTVARAPNGSAAELSLQQREILKRGDASRRIARKTQLGLDNDGGTSTGERRDQIILAAAQLFVKHGYSGTSIRDIADRVGMLPGSVYHYYPSKEDLFVAIHREGFRRLMHNIREAIRGASDPWERLELACAEHVNDVAAGNPISQVTATGLFAIYETRLQRRLRADRENFEQLFRQLIADLDLADAIDRSLFRLALLGSLNWTHVWYKAGKKTPREIAAQLIAISKTRRIASAAAAD